MKNPALPALLIEELVGDKALHGTCSADESIWVGHGISSKGGPSGSIRISTNHASKLVPG